MTVNKKDFDSLHEKVDDIAESVARIEGKLEQKSEGWTLIGIWCALIMGVYNIFKGA